jgi:peroxiredoxin-like protein
MAEGGVKTKTFEFATHLKWSAERHGELSMGPEKQVVRAGAPLDFKGDARNISPEDMFLSALSVCQMTTFLAFAYRTGLEFLSYEDKAEGIMEIVDRKLKFTRVVLHPRVTVKSDEDKEKAAKLMHDAHEACAITNSVNCPVEMEPEITVG